MGRRRLELEGPQGPKPRNVRLPKGVDPTSPAAQTVLLESFEYFLQGRVPTVYDVRGFAKMQGVKQAVVYALLGEVLSRSGTDVARSIALDIMAQGNVLRNQVATPKTTRKWCDVSRVQVAMISAVASFQRAGQKEEEIKDLLSHLSLDELRTLAQQKSQDATAEVSVEGPSSALQATVPTTPTDVPQPSPAQGGRDDNSDHPLL
jgi:hypothetical protein